MISSSFAGRSGFRGTGAPPTVMERDVKRESVAESIRSLRNFRSGGSPLSAPALARVHTPPDLAASVSIRLQVGSQSGVLPNHSFPSHHVRSIPATFQPPECCLR
jgi:hypothetical protein